MRRVALAALVLAAALSPALPTAGADGTSRAMRWERQDSFERAVTARPLDSACGDASEDLVDVARSNPHHRGISCLYLWSVATGTAPGRFSPDQAVSRAQMATFIARLLTSAGTSLPANPSSRFTDVPASSPHARAVNQLAQIGVVSGNGGRYSPDAPVNRAQMTTFIARAITAVAGASLPRGADAFTDDDGDVHEDSINRVAAAGVATGVSATTFAPGRSVSRAQMGSFLARTLALFVDELGVPSRASDLPIEGPAYTFIAMGRTQPARWDPCAATTLPWQIVGAADPDWIATLEEAFAAASAATGLTLTRQPSVSVQRRIDVSFDPYDDFPPGAVGLAIPEGVHTSAGEIEFNYGRLSFNRDFFEYSFRPGASANDLEGAKIVALHEVAHILGLDHVTDPRLLMAPNLDPRIQDPVYGPGERAGLRLVGASQGCVP